MPLLTDYVPIAAESGGSPAVRQNAAVLIDDYRRYITAANDRQWDLLGDHVADHVQVNGQLIDRAAYVDDLRRLIEAHPQHRWEIADLLTVGNRIAVRLTTYQPGAQGFELAHYTWRDGRIFEVWTVGALP